MNILVFFIFAFFTVFPIYVQANEEITENPVGFMNNLKEALNIFGGELQMHQCGEKIGEDVQNECNFLQEINNKLCITVNDHDIQQNIQSVVNYGVSEACECCKNPAKCAIGLPGGVEKLLEGLGIVGGLVGTIGGVSKICKDVKMLQSALAGLNAWAGIKCQRLGRTCRKKHEQCTIQITQLETTIKERITICNEMSTTTSIITELESYKEKLESYKEKLQQSQSNCEFASKAGKAQVMQGAAFGVAAVVSHLCQKSTEGGEERQDPCLIEDSAEYNTPRCQCKRGEQPEGVDCCVYDSLSPSCRANDPCSVNPSSTECICSQPGTQNLPQCRDNSGDIPIEDPGFIEDPNLDIGNPDDIGTSEFNFLKNPGEKGSPFGGLPEIPPNLKNKSAFSPKTSKPSGVKGGGSPSAGGGSLPSGGGGLGGEGGDPEEEGESPYSNLLDGLSGKQNQNGAGGVGGFNSYGGKSGNPFDLKKFLPKGKNRKPSSKNKKAGDSSAIGESIFQRASRVTRVYCSKNQVECVPNSQPK